MARTAWSRLQGTGLYRARGGKGLSETETFKVNPEDATIPLKTFALG